MIGWINRYCTIVLQCHAILESFIDDIADSDGDVSTQHIIMTFSSCFI
jgi:hypothetical protein